jgi:hypothetical protein
MPEKAGRMGSMGTVREAALHRWPKCVRPGGLRAAGRTENPARTILEWISLDDRVSDRKWL